MPFDIRGAMSHIVSGVLSGIVFLAFLFIIRLDFIYSLGIGLIAYVASLFTFSSYGRRKDMIPDGMTEDQVNKTIGDVTKKLEILKSHAERADKASVKTKLQDISRTVENILENFKKDPKDIKAAKNFLNYYLDATINLIGKYEDLSTRRVKSENIQATLAKAESLMNIIRESFHKQYEKLLEDDVMNLDVEIEVLEKTLKMEGL